MNYPRGSSVNTRVFKSGRERQKSQPVRVRDGDMTKEAEIGMM